MKSRICPINGSPPVHAGGFFLRTGSDLGAPPIPPTNERGLLHHWHDRDDPSLWDAESVFLDGPDHAEILTRSNSALLPVRNIGRGDSVGLQRNWLFRLF